MENEHDTGFFFPHQRGQRISEAYQLYLPRSVREPFRSLEAYWVADFLTPQECDKLIALVDTKYGAPIDIDDVNQDGIATHVCNLTTLEDDLVTDVDSRICRYMGMNATYSEPLQGEYYGVGESFQAHVDYLPDTSASLAQQGQRTWTFMVFLNNVEEGGGTSFPHLNRVYTPKAGAAIVWRNLDLAGYPNPYSLHTTEPLQRGYKAVLSKKFRQRGEGPRFTRAVGEYLPAYSTDDMRKVRIPESLLGKIQAYVRHNFFSSATPERGVEDFVKSAGDTASLVIDLSPQLRDEMHRVLAPIHEEWCGLPLYSSLVYGVRRYLQGATIEPHLDTAPTHSISATMNIGQSLNKPWPLCVRDTFYRKHEVILQPGEMLLYEGARLEHSRPEPLDGNYYDAAFVHYHP